MSYRPTVCLYHDTRKPKKNGRFTVAVRVTFKLGPAKWKQSYYSTGVDLSESDWEKVRKGSVRGELRAVRARIMEKEKQALDIITKDPFIKASNFDLIYSGRVSQSAMISPLFDEMVTTMFSEGRISSAGLYKISKSALIAFGGDGLTLDQIDADWLSDFESSSRKKGLSPTTIGIYLRNLRTVYNIAIDRKIVSHETYPFGRKRYVIPSSRNIKKALTEKDKIRLVKYRAKDKKQAAALKHWTFSYYCNGMNFSDMAHLTKENIRGDMLTFRRNKTSRSKRQAQPLVVVLRREALEILRGQSGDPYLFGIIKTEDSPKQRKSKIHDWIKKTNKALKDICADLGIERVTTYTARHTAATMMLRSKADIIAIRDALGHSSVTTTEQYLASLDLDQKRSLSEKL